MKGIFNKPLIVFLLFSLPALSLHATSVAGIYSPPAVAVKFEKEANFSILPVGWSKDGKTAFFIHDHKAGRAWLLIIDTVSDAVLYNSDPEPLKEGGDAALWNSKSSDFSSHLSHAGIIPDNKPVYGGSSFTIGKDKYSISAKTKSLEGEKGIATLSLTIRSDRRGSKVLYSYTYDGESKTVLMNFSVLGYFRSPWEHRIAVISVGDYTSPGTESRLKLQVNGAHLTIGYRHDLTPDRKLTNAVLSGQYYTTRLLLDGGADPSYVVPGFSALIVLAAERGSWDIVFLLLDRGADPTAVGKGEETLLHYAAAQGNRDAVVKLLARGFNRKFKDHKGKTPLQLAIDAGHGELTSLLKE